MLPFRPIGKNPPWLFFPFRVTMASTSAGVRAKVSELSASNANVKLRQYAEG